ncbi:MAG TPA: MOSC domain-containing protein [Dehalococcoidia bacterium]|nr:MOSC domain-containing protein [Dehalococcoidia bacterium]
MRIGTVKEIRRYPVKSMAGEQIDHTHLGPLGVTGDRAWALHDTEAGEIRGAKKIPNLLHFAARYLGQPGDGYEATPVQITTPSDGSVDSTDGDVSTKLSHAVGRPVTLSARPDPEKDLDHYRAGAPLFPDDPMKDLRYIMGLEDDDPIPDFSGFPPEMRDYASPPGTYFDGFPLHILTTASLDELQRINPDSNYDVRRFRPNLLIDTDESLSGFVESAWGGQLLRIGDVAIRINISAVRCAMPMQSQETLDFDKGTLRTIKDHNGQHLGIYCTVETPGEVKIGDEVTLD